VKDAPQTSLATAPVLPRTRPAPPRRRQPAGPPRPAPAPRRSQRRTAGGAPGLPGLALSAPGARPPYGQLYVSHGTPVCCEDLQGALLAATCGTQGRCALHQALLQTIHAPCAAFAVRCKASRCSAGRQRCAQVSRGSEPAEVLAGAHRRQRSVLLRNLHAQQREVLRGRPRRRRAGRPAIAARPVGARARPRRGDLPDCGVVAACGCAGRSTAAKGH